MATMRALSGLCLLWASVVRANDDNHMVRRRRRRTASAPPPAATARALLNRLCPSSPCRPQ